MGTFELYTDTRGQHRFRLKAGNGEIILVSEAYTAKASAENGIASVRVNAPSADRYERKSTVAGHSFTLKARNGEVIGASEVYTTTTARDKGIASVQANAPGAKVVEM